MSKIETGGTAFPAQERIDYSSSVIEYYPGMTLRDYFAAKAMPVVWAEIPEDANRELALNHLGIASYEMADAMLKARQS